VTNTILDAGTDRRIVAGVVLPGSGFRPFTTTGARDTAITSPVEGNAVDITGEDRLYTYNGSAWARTSWYSSGGRTGVTLRRAANQLIASATTVPILWDTEDQTRTGSSPCRRTTSPCRRVAMVFTRSPSPWRDQPVGTSSASRDLS
jgi:hypothetical protein